MRYSISNTAQYGDMVSGPRVIDPQVKENMREILTEIQEGVFARNWLTDNRVGRPQFNALTRQGEEHPIEEVGAKLRGMMSWIGKNKIVDKSKN
jgi:ketol-acid reductoisomerase